MDESLSDLIDSPLRSELFEVGGTPVSASSLIVCLLIIVVGFIAARLIDNALARVLSLGGNQISEVTSTVLRRFIRYFVIVLGFVVGLEYIEIHLSTLFTAGAIFAVGFGFAMQDIARNFVSGAILLMERSITHGDVIEVEGVVVRIAEMGIRATIARTREEEELIIPNSTLAQTTVKNYTLTDALFRVRSEVGVVYSSDMAQVRQVLDQVGRSFEWRAKRKDPLVLLRSFGDSAVIFELSVWIADPWDAQVAGSRVNEGIWNALKDAGIVIAFPQIDLHFDERANEAIQALSAMLPAVKDEHSQPTVEA